MIELKAALELDLRDEEGDASALIPTYERLLSLTLQTGRLVERNVRRDISDLVRERKDTLIAASAVGISVTKVLREAGGSLRQTDVLVHLTSTLKDQLSKADQEARPKGGARWHNRLYRARQQLIREGKLTVGRGKNPLWELTA
jgi:hypothetical protein